MHYFIDGYNLMFRVLRTGEELQKMREEIIRNLEIQVNLLELDVTIVFDAHYQNTGISRSRLNFLEILFTNVNETADEFIVQAIHQDRKPSRHIVVTSDKKLARFSNRLHAHAIGIDEFISWIEKRCKNKLRSQKIKPKPILPHSKLVEKKPLQIPEPVQSTLPPSSSAEDCFDFYLETFNKNASELIQKKAELREIKKSKKSKNYKKKEGLENKIQETPLSNMDRWKKAFERDLKDEQ